mmetsp:Transcript_34394/g.31103  ORF Transcript_34394/g.31103 Transcript_34394/m.31103 type:complete len:139 (+) Transcript_34394:1538-1954(+)
MKPGITLDLFKPPIIYVDDNPFNLMVTKDIVEKHCRDAEGFSSPFEALERILERHGDKEPVKYVLTDIEMPGMDGYEFAWKLMKLMEEKKIEKLKIIGFSAHESKCEKQKCLKSGMYDYLSKPLSNEKFKEFILNEND